MVVLMTSGISLAAQEPGSVRGSVTDKDFDIPVPGVQITIVETNQKAMTLDEGNFVMSRVAPGKYTLVFTKDGYLKQTRVDVLVAAGRLTELSVALSGDVTDMDEFIVQDILRFGSGTEGALLQLRLESPAFMDSIGSDLMSRAGASDAASALRLVAGASVADGKTAVIRGLPDRYVSSQLNGVRLPTADENKRAVELDQYPAVVIDSIQVSKTFTPDQQADASGGAVNLKLKGIPEEDAFFNVKAQASRNTQVTGRKDFLSYDGGGLRKTGEDTGKRAPQTSRIGSNWKGGVGVMRADAPDDYKWSGATGGRVEIADGVRLGGFVSFFYERDSSFHDNGIDDSYWVERPGAKMTPKASQGAVTQGDFKTSLLDVIQARQSVQLGGLGAIGLESKNHALTLGYLYTRNTEDSATLARDTRGKQYFFPGYDPKNASSPGHEAQDAAPYLQLETLEYTERTTSSLQLQGHHRFPIDDLWVLRSPEIDWTVAHSEAQLYQPDKRQFGSLWVPGRTIGPFVIPAEHRQYKPSANFTLGNLQRIYKNIKEDSDQYSASIKTPFEPSSETKGYLKIGLFHDVVHRKFNQDTFSNFNDNSSFEGEYEQFWSKVFPSEDHPITESLFDVDYTGRQKIDAWYAMVDLPLTASLSLIGGARFERTSLGIVNNPEASATWFPPGSLTQTALRPGDADVNFRQDDILPSVGLVYKPWKSLTLRTSYNETVARQTFKELTPILQQEYLGGPVFIGNPNLKMSALQNYDLRADYTPYEGGLVSASWFKKDIKGPIEYVQRVASFDFTSAVNYPKGELSGFEVETRHALGHFWEVLEGFAIGANATFIDSRVRLPDDEAAEFELPNIKAPMKSRDMTNAPDHLYNLFATWDIPGCGTQLGLFYTVQGDSLVAGAGQSNGNYVPNVYSKGYDTLNLSVTQAIGKHVKLFFGAKNLTNPEIQEVYRSAYIGDDVLKTSFTKGIEYAFGIGGEFRF